MMHCPSHEWDRYIASMDSASDAAIAADEALFGTIQGQLDLSDPEDRAAFRTRMARSFRIAKLAALNEYLTERGLPESRSCSAAIRRLADYWIENN